MPTPAELKDREDHLKADEVNWRAKQKELERIIQKHNLTLDELVPKLQRITTMITEKTTELDSLTGKIRTANSEIVVKETQVKAIDGKITISQSTLRDLEAVIEHKRSQVDSDLAAWSEKRRADYRAETKADEESAIRAKEAVASIQIEIDAKRDELDEARQETAMMRQTHARELEKHQRDLSNLVERQIPLEAAIVALTAETTKLQRTREVQLVDTAKAKQEFDGFLDYERRARKVLDTKDRELQDKSQEIAQANRHLATRSSFLRDL